MATTKTAKPEAKPEEAQAKEDPKVEDDYETRIDEFGVSVFQSLGYKGRLPDPLVQAYNDFKRVKDRMHPGRLTPEGFAFVVMFAKQNGLDAK